MTATNDRLDRLAESILASPKYHSIYRDLVRRIASQEAAKGRSEKETLKAVKNKLHQIAGAYLERQPDYDAWLDELRQVSRTGSQAEVRDICRTMMRAHASTRERLPILERFYAETLSGLPPIHTVLDVACGLNPLALPWMGFTNEVEYLAVDIYTDMMRFLNGALGVLGAKGTALPLDVVESIPEPQQPFDLAFLLKSIPCLEQIDKSASKRLLEKVPARRLLVSFPARSLGGRQKGMVENYEARFQEMVAGKGWGIRRFEFPNELAFLITRG